MTTNDSRTDAQLRMTRVGGHSIAYRESGSGSALVLLHGFLSDSRCWQPQLSALSDRFRVVAWDAPGAGSSSDPSEPFNTAAYAHCFAGFLDALDIRRVHMLGLSWGGILSQEFYRLYPDRLCSLILAGTYAGWKGSLPDHVWRERLASCLRDASASRDAVVAKLLPSMFSDTAPQHIIELQAAIMSEYHPIGFRLMALSSAEMDTRDFLPLIKVPTLVLWGVHDRRSPLNAAEQIAALVPGAELALIPDAGHVSNMERPDAFNSHVRRFCLSHEDRVA
jgi:pimeloyl-ACP methyl ester carboxylesterase